ncbi:HDOD domain-containing protein [Crenobacter cavernae]|uniref:HDOD domain-containing protein n=1 Tax=Crenobacter cavernae TaxID=2290923 RepID=A0A345Y4E9_9NEIS|nr:HDOD domain-containing protein [Crenobacter cavernae]AXK38801.1 HDOD domain-containing protein [Crenobacter cavernae]
MQASELFELTQNRLPTVPKVVQELIASLQNESVSYDKVVDMLAHDQVLTARVLRLANSAHSGGHRRVGSLDDAVLLLGFNKLRVLVIASGLAGTTIKVPGFDMQGFWRRSFEVANTARRLARAAGLDESQAAICGLLANIGELVLHVGLPAEALKIDKVVASGADRVSTERIMLGMDLTEVGAELARCWHFPDAIHQAILFQHSPQDAPGSLYASLLALANHIVAGYNSGIGEDEMAAMLPGRLLVALGLPQQTLTALLPELKSTSTTTDEWL